MLAAAALAGLAGMDSGITLAAASREPGRDEPRPTKPPAHRMPHQGNRERERRRKQLAKAAAKVGQP